MIIIVVIKQKIIPTIPKNHIAWTIKLCDKSPGIIAWLFSVNCRNRYFAAFNIDVAPIAQGKVIAQKIGWNWQVQNILNNNR